MRYDMRLATIAVGVQFSDAFNAGERNPNWEPDVRKAIAENSDVPPDRLDAAAEAVRDQMPQLRLALAALCSAVGHVPTREDLEQFIGGAYWLDDEGDEAIEVEIVEERESA